MKSEGNLEKLFQQYKKLDFVLSIEDEKEMMYEYVYATNKLEGNKLSLAQTTQLLSSDTISGNNIRTTDILEQKGMYKALTRMLNAVKNNDELSIELMVELNWLSLGHLWNYEDSYIDAKSKGQKEGEFKVSKNLIRISRGEKIIKHLEPLSEPKAVKKNMIKLIETIKHSDRSVIYKAAYLAQELWLHQPFMDGNKRTGRLLVNFLTMKEEYPLFSFESDTKNYNNILIEQYFESKPTLLTNYIEMKLAKKIQYYINLNKKSKDNSKGFRMLL